tara:strand:+ start:1191 stop:1655 length:465 start_codon:yes stop_codon:yes gene_type:complete
MGSKAKKWWGSLPKSSKAFIIGSTAGLAGLAGWTAAAGAKRGCKGGSCPSFREGGKVRKKKVSANAVPEYYDQGGAVGKAATVSAKEARRVAAANQHLYKGGGAVPNYYDKGGKLKANLGWKQKLASLGVGAALAGFTYALDRKSAKQREKDQE